MRRFLEKMATSPCQVVADFYDASLDPTRWPQALLSLGECMKADAVGLLLHDFEDGSGRFERGMVVTHGPTGKLCAQQPLAAF